MSANTIKFKAYGHENVRGEHNTTIEFNKDDYLTWEGDCIVGIKSDYNISEIRKIKDQLKKVKVTISCKNITDTVICYFNPTFSDATHMIIRKSDYVDERTFAIKANKCAKELSRELVTAMKEPGVVINVKIEPVKIKAVIFDFDNTLEEWSKSAEIVLRSIAAWVNEEFHITEEDFIRLFHESSEFYGRLTNKVFRYSRRHWFKRVFDAEGIPADPVIYEKLFWQEIKNTVQLLPGARETLEAIKLKKGLLSDSDGEKIFKIQRIKHLGIEHYFDDITLGDDVGIVKPNEEIFHLSAIRLEVEPEECLYVGDRPLADFPCSKKLGMTTVYSYQNVEWGEYPNIDYSIPNIILILKVIEKLNG